MLAFQPSRIESNWTQLRIQANALIGGVALHRDTRLGPDKRRSYRGLRWSRSSLETPGLAGTSLAVVCVGSLSWKNAVLHEPLHVAIETYLPAQFTAKWTREPISHSAIRRPKLAVTISGKGPPSSFVVLVRTRIQVGSQTATTSTSCSTNLIAFIPLRRK